MGGAEAMFVRGTSVASEAAMFVRGTSLEVSGRVSGGGEGVSLHGGLSGPCFLSAFSGAGVRLSWGMPSLGGQTLSLAWFCISG